MIAHSKPFITDLEKQFVSLSLESPVITGGSYTKEFNASISSYLQCDHFIYSSSGAESLYLILKALGIKNGDEVILPSYVCDSVYYAVRNAGAIPVLVEVNENWVSTPEQIKNRITERTKAIIVVYTFGLPCNIEAICKLGVPVIEDICQAMGLEINGKKAGSFGVASFISFAAIKCITTAGEGGGVLTNNKELSEKIATLRKQQVVNHRITEAQAAFGCAQLKQYGQFLEKRKSLANDYQKVVVASSHVLKTSHGNGMNYRFVIQTDLDVEDTMRKFAEKGISLRRGVDAVLHKTFEVSGDFKETERVFNSTLSFPIYPALSNEEFDKVCTTIKQLM